MPFKASLLFRNNIYLSGMLSRIAYFIAVALLACTSFVFYPRWKQPATNATISWDVSGYYWYLPSLFIYHDIKNQGFKDSILQKYQPTNTDFQQGVKQDNGGYVMKYASGMALMYLPFFAAAHLLAAPLGYPPDGFSPPYQLAIQLGGFLVAILGLWYLRRLLLLFYDDKVTATVLLLLVAGTNYLNYAAVDGGMSHNWLFTIYVFILLNTVYFHRAYQAKYALRIGLLVGLATLTRPTDALACILPLLWGMEGLGLPAIIKRVQLLLGHYRPLLLAAAVGLAVVSIQFVYWKYASGHWAVYSYSDQHLYFRSPNFFDYTLSYRSGWLTYSPMMVLAFVGLVPFLLRGSNKVAITSFFLLNYYIVCCWSIWWYGGRAMVQSYPVLVFPIASLVAVAFDKKALWALLAPVVAVFVYFNVWITWHYHKGNLYDPECMTAPYFWRVIGRWNVPERTVQLRDNTELYEGSPANMQLLYTHDFETDTGAGTTHNAIAGHTSAMMDKTQERYPVLSFPYSGGTGWLRAQATFRAKEKEWDVWIMPQFVVRLIRKNGTDKPSIIKDNMIRVSRMLGDNETREIAIDVQLPATQFDTVHILFWNGGSSKQLTIDDVKVWAFQ